MSSTALTAFFSFTDATTTDLYTLSLHDALPIYANPVALDRVVRSAIAQIDPVVVVAGIDLRDGASEDRKSTRLNSSHRCSSYAVFCLKKKNRSTTTRSPGTAAESSLPSTSLRSW